MYAKPPVVEVTFLRIVEATLKSSLKTMWKRGPAVLLALAALFVLVGCAGPMEGPRYIDQITSSQKSVKMLYHQQVGATTRRGLIECERTPDGSLQNCKDVAINFVEPEKE